MDVPTNLEARRRIAFFTNSLFMDMPRAPRVRKMLSFRLFSYSNLLTILQIAVGFKWYCSSIIFFLFLMTHLQKTCMWT
jgi:hypothetical protein